MQAKRILREPLFHFLMIGGLLFVLHGFVSPDDSEEQETIHISAEHVDQLRESWRRQWQRFPTRHELAERIDARIRDEILYREALAFGMDEDDTVVRDRLIQKMDFIISGGSIPLEPETAALEKYLADHREEYEIPAVLSFNHIFFSRDERGDQSKLDAQQVLAELAKGDPPPATALDRGDEFLMRSEYKQVSRNDVARTFGVTFARELFPLKVGGWQGPLESSYGHHLVHIQERAEARPATLDEARDRVLPDYQMNQRRLAAEREYQRLRERYKIVVEGLPDITNSSQAGE